MKVSRKLEAAFVAFAIALLTFVLVYQFRYNRKFLYQRAHQVFVIGEYEEAMALFEKFLLSYSAGKYVKEAKSNLDYIRCSKKAYEDCLFRIRYGYSRRTSILNLQNIDYADSEGVWASVLCRVLLEDQDPKAREAAAYILYLSAPPWALPVWIKALDDENERVVWYCLCALEEITGLDTGLSQLGASRIDAQKLHRMAWKWEEWWTKQQTHRNPPPPKPLPDANLRANHTFEEIRSVHYSPDGTKLAILGRQTQGSNGISLISDWGDIETLVEDNAVNMHWLPNGHDILYCAPSNSGGQDMRPFSLGGFSIFMVSTRTKKKRFIAEGMDPVPSTTGKLIAYLSRNQSLMTADLGNGPEESVREHQVYPFPRANLAWSPDGTSLACFAKISPQHDKDEKSFSGELDLSWPIRLVVVNAQDDKSYVVSDGCFGTINRTILHWSTDGAYLYYRTSSDGDHLLRFNAITRKREQVFDFRKLPVKGQYDVLGVFRARGGLIYSYRNTHALWWYDWNTATSSPLLTFEDSSLGAIYSHPLVAPHPSGRKFAVVWPSKGIYIVDRETGRKKRIACITQVQAPKN